MNRIPGVIGLEKHHGNPVRSSLLAWNSYFLPAKMGDNGEWRAHHGGGGSSGHILRTIGRHLRDRSGSVDVLLVSTGGSGGCHAAATLASAADNSRRLRRSAVDGKRDEREECRDGDDEEAEGDTDEEEVEEERRRRRRNQISPRQSVSAHLARLLDFRRNHDSESCSFSSSGRRTTSGEQPPPPTSPHGGSGGESSSGSSSSSGQQVHRHHHHHRRRQSASASLRKVLQSLSLYSGGAEEGGYEKTFSPQETEVDAADIRSAERDFWREKEDPEDSTRLHVRERLFRSADAEDSDQKVSEGLSPALLFPLAAALPASTNVILPCLPTSGNESYRGARALNRRSGLTFSESLFVVSVR
ncbi:hypothetical protein J437_LFUL002463 [Ladona fulva]|uniref:Uncharacterized protein n=1 Tax=Ladona fulva TaxID=123851 RepID=A0A8K0KP38_LADFU|nr:hypothetical protein J437_LFUL002463 [Ladona fulva]